MTEQMKIKNDVSVSMFFGQWAYCVKCSHGCFTGARKNCTNEKCDVSVLANTYAFGIFYSNVDIILHKLLGEEELAPEVWCVEQH